ncbi:MAG: hypothetical protein ACOVMQ_01305, partial [Cyclobacteriaceae bacterium]
IVLSIAKQNSQKIPHLFFGGIPLEAGPCFSLQVLVARGAPLWAFRFNHLPTPAPQASSQPITCYYN